MAWRTPPDGYGPWEPGGAGRARRVLGHRGAMVEVVDDGVTGILVHGLEEAVESLDAVAGLDRGRCRETAVRRFAASRMVDDYREVHARLVARS